MYKITNNINQKLYIGKTSCQDPRQRWYRHVNVAKYGPARLQFHLHNAIQKHGPQNFSFEILESHDSESLAFEREKFYIEKYNTFYGEGYNLSEGGDGPSGRKHSAATKQKLRDAMLGRYEGADNPFWGKTHSEDVRKKLSELASKRCGTKSNRWGKKHSPESISKMRRNVKKKQRYVSLEKAELIRADYATGKYTYAMLAEKHSLTFRTTSRVLRFAGVYAADKEASHPT